MDKEQGLAHLRALRKRIDRTKTNLDGLYEERARLFAILRGVASNNEIAKAAGVTDVMVVRTRNHREQAS